MEMDADRVEVAIRLHRRMSGMLAHPLSDRVLHPLMRERVAEARDILSAALGYPDSLVKAIGQRAADDEITVQIAADGQYVFNRRPDWKEG
jgi:hypothetical protein